MTTIACNLSEMAADTKVTYEGVGTDAFAAVKLFRGKSAIYGVSGENCTGALRALHWLQSNRRKPAPLPPEYEHSWSWTLIELSASGIAIYNEYMEREISLEPCLAIGSGRKVALYCMKVLGMSPTQAVAEACKVDNYTNVPIYSAKLRASSIVRWKE